MNATINNNSNNENQKRINGQIKVFAFMSLLIGYAVVSHFMGNLVTILQ